MFMEIILLDFYSLQMTNKQNLKHVQNCTGFIFFTFYGVVCH